MEKNPEKERDTIAWYRVGLVVVSALVGLVLFISDTRPAAYFFLGYALLSAAMMFVFKTWRSSSEVTKAHKSHLKRMVRNIPRGIFRFFLGFIAFMIALATGSIPLYFTSNDFYHEHEQLFNVYIYFLVAVSVVILFWVGGFIKSMRQTFSDLKEIREAAKRSKERRSEKKRKENY